MRRARVAALRRSETMQRHGFALLRIAEETPTGAKHERPVSRQERGERRLGRHRAALVVQRNQFSVGRANERAASPECREITKDGLWIPSGHLPELLGTLSHRYNAGSAKLHAKKYRLVRFSELMRSDSTHSLS